MMELYTAGTGNGQRAAIAVNECGVSCKIHVLNLGQGDQKAADYVKINPTARIPTLIDPEGPGGRPLTVSQSWAILMYLCEKTGKFLPADPVARVRMFHLPSNDRRSELMIIYGEALPAESRVPVSEDGVSLDTADPAEAKLILQRALQGLTLRKHRFPE